MARFDIYVNPNKSATHAYYVDVQSDFVRLNTRWCIPLFLHRISKPVIVGAQTLVQVDHHACILDTPNLLAVPASLLRQQAGRMSAGDQLLAESCVEFMLRGY